MISKLIRYNMICLLILSLSTTLMANCGGCEADNIDEGIQSFYLPQNGLKVILKEEHAIPMIGMSLFYNVGSHDEPSGVKGMTKLQTYLAEESGSTSKEGWSPDDFKEGVVTLRGWTANEFKGLIKGLTRSSDIYSDRDVFSITHEFNKTYLQDILQLEANRMEFLDITDSSLVRAKAIFKSKLAHRYKDNISAAFNDLNRFEEDHPYVKNEWGDWLEVDSISLNTAIEYRQKYFNPNNATLVLVGDFKSAEIVGIVNSLFGGIENKSSVPIDPEFAINNKEHVLIDDVFDDNIPVLYGQLAMCNINIPSFRDADMIIMEHVIRLLNYDNAFGGIYSRKYLNKIGTFSFTNINPSIGPSEVSFVALNPFLRKKDKSLKKIIKKMIIHISEDGFSDELLSKYKKRELIADYRKGYEYRNTAWDLGRSELVLGDYNHYNRTTKVLERLDNDEIKRVVSKYLVNRDVNTIEALMGEKRWHTPIFRLIFAIAKPAIQNSELKQLMLPREQ